MARGEKRRKLTYEKPCRVYWGSHGCDKVRGHGGEHICTGCGPCYSSLKPGLDAYWGVMVHHHGPADITLDPQYFYGEDVELYQVLGMEC
jgi:hypothetical protein